MKVVFLSNYYNHHQAVLAERMNSLLDGGYYFITTGRISSHRIKMGWTASNIPDFVHDYTDKLELCTDLISSADVVIQGSVSEKLLKERLRDEKLTFIYSERLDKIPLGFFPLIRNTVRLNLTYGFRKNLYCLCASAFTAYDLSKRRLVRDKCYKWGYFPEVYRYECIEKLLEAKQTDPVSILFVSRMIEWKHPKLPVYAAKRLKEEGIRFHLTMIGIGGMEDQIHKMIEDYDLSREITHIRSMSPKEVRGYMEKSSIFLFTSDRNEGWGVVLNEAMNSACGVVASSAIGSVPFLLKDGQNGCIYQDNNFDDLYAKVRELCVNQQKRERLGIEAYKTIVGTWNAENAAKRLLELIKDLQKQGYSDRYKEGPCSKADILKDDWYQVH